MVAPPTRRYEGGRERDAGAGVVAISSMGIVVVVVVDIVMDHVHV